ncbi:hypothetical protein Scep_029082 [Stephania cephalantha]|uniref:Uncharacterized protein n=1 Tax=Stephania cephalantha TaxID=152367 RepID=A0AAP0DX55_9MAGN
MPWLRERLGVLFKSHKYPPPPALELQRLLTMVANYKVYLMMRVSVGRSWRTVGFGFWPLINSTSNDGINCSIYAIHTQSRSLTNKSS